MLTILVVEDNACIRKPMARLLRFEGFETFCAGNGQEALDALDLVRPDLILLDLMMPVMGGVEFLTILRDNPLWANLPVIVMTARPPDDDSVRAARLLGAKEYFLTADFTLGQLCTSIRRNLAA